MILWAEDLNRGFRGWNTAEESLAVVGVFDSLQTFNVAWNFWSQVETYVTIGAW